MNEILLTRLAAGWTALGLILLPVLLRITAPYGRHSTAKWGPVISNRAAWMIMEAPALLVFIFFFLYGNGLKNTVHLLAFAAWVIHYTNRSFIYPLRIRNHRRMMPLAVMLMAFCFNLTNGFLNGWGLGNAAVYSLPAWLQDPRFITGLLLFLSGMYINWWADNRLIGLRKNLTPGSYAIPQGGLFRLVSCPNFLGEIVEWGGFALMTWSPAALSFFIWTVVNLLPRALDHHRWYRERFPGYPRERKALIPFLV